MNNIEIMRLAKLGKKAERRRWNRKRFFNHLFVTTIGFLVDSWTMMLLVGIVHAEWIPGLPTIGYLWAIPVTVLLQSTLRITSTNNTPTMGAQ